MFSQISSRTLCLVQCCVPNFQNGGFYTARRSILGTK